MIKIIIMCHSSWEVHIFDLPNFYRTTPEDFIVNQVSTDGRYFTLGNTDFMVVDLSKQGKSTLPVYIH